jgi:hypothetical protein
VWAFASIRRPSRRNAKNLNGLRKSFRVVGCKGFYAFCRLSKTVGATGFKTCRLIDLEGGRPTQMAYPLLNGLKPENSWSLNVAVVRRHEDAN